MSSDQINLIKLITTEIIIAKISYNPEDSSVLILTSPYVLVPSRDGLAIANWIPFIASKSLTIKKEHILYISIPIDDITVQYKQAVSDIIIPTASVTKSPTPRYKN